MAHKLISKAEAKKRELKFYDDAPCRKCGHTERYTNSGKCTTCHAERNKRRKRGKAGKTASTAVALTNTEPISGGVLSGDWRFYSDRITAALRAGVESMVERIVEAGTLLIEAKDKVEHGDWGKLVADLPVSGRTVQMLMAIAANPVLSNPKHASDLPPHWYTLYQLTKLPEPVLRDRIADHSINLKMQRKDIAAITGARHPKTKLRRRSKADERAIEEINRLKAHNAELEAARDNAFMDSDDDETLGHKIIMRFGRERAAVLIAVVQRLLSNGASEAA
jgi:hypothetical protein